VTACRELETPLGTLLAVASPDALLILEFPEHGRAAAQVRRIGAVPGGTIEPGDSPLLQETERQLRAYFAGTLRDFDLPLLTPGSPFQQQVWQELRTIPYGATRSYGEQATRIGRPDAVRAVARANGENRIAIIIPCHRVIGANGRLTGYGGGLHRKQWLLSHEVHHQPLAGQAAAPGGRG
jgi:AraC family transcriptional regulator, regulatory protein of adaptative response / methylated-DNA-[protein]-cysteine methyltransferase